MLGLANEVRANLEEVLFELDHVLESGVIHHVHSKVIDDVDLFEFFVDLILVHPIQVVLRLLGDVVWALVRLATVRAVHSLVHGRIGTCFNGSRLRAGRQELVVVLALELPALEVHQASDVFVIFHF